MKLALAAIATVSLAASAWSQTGDIRAVTEYRIKVDRGTEFTDLQKQFAAEIKKSGSTRARYVFQLLSGPRAYISVTYHEKWAEMDTAPTQTPGIAALLARINSCVESSDRRVDLIDRSLSIRESEAMPNMVQVVRVSVRPEKVDEYLALAKSTSYPAYKKAGVKRRIFARVRLGGPSTDFVTSVGLDKWADLDGPNPLERGLGAKGYQDFLSKLSTMIYRSQFDVFRYLPDASYVPSR